MVGEREGVYLMEPEAIRIFKDKGLHSVDSDILALTSLAISMKRIADQLTYQGAGDANIFDFIREISARK
jgi:hypothetical protein